MTRQQSQLIKAAIISTLVVIGGGASLAAAGGGGERGYGGYGGYRDSGYTRYGYAGSISIDGYWTRIDMGRPLLRQIAGAFRAAGYDVWIANGCVQVDYGYRRPSVRWYRGAYNTRFDWDYGLLSLSAYRNHRGYQPRVIHKQPRHPIRRVRGWGRGYTH